MRTCSKISVTEKAEESQQQLDALQLDEQQLESQLSQTRSLPSREEIVDKHQEAAGQILAMECSSGDVLERILKGPVRAVPCQQFGSNKVVLRAKMTLQLAEVGKQGMPFQLSNEVEQQPDCAMFETDLIGDYLRHRRLPGMRYQSVCRQSDLIRAPFHSLVIHIPASSTQQL